jgi:hypothetical protein
MPGTRQCCTCCCPTRTPPWPTRRRRSASSWSGCSRWCCPGTSRTPGPARPGAQQGSGLVKGPGGGGGAWQGACCGSTGVRVQRPGPVLPSTALGAPSAELQRQAGPPRRLRAAAATHVRARRVEDGGLHARQVERRHDEEQRVGPPDVEGEARVHGPGLGAAIHAHLGHPARRRPVHVRVHVSVAGLGRRCAARGAGVGSETSG